MASSHIDKVNLAGTAIGINLSRRRLNAITPQWETHVPCHEATIPCRCGRFVATVR